MYVALLGGSGRAGSRILKELVDRGHRVRAILRAEPEAAAGEDWPVADLADAGKTSDAIRGTGAVVSAYAPPGGDTDALVGVCRTLAEAVAQSGAGRLLVVGGAGVLEVAPGVTLIDSGKLPPEWMPIARSHAKALAELRSSAVNWTYLAPAAYFDPGERTGRYRMAGERLVMDEQGNSRISMEDYAIALVDELESAAHPRAVVSVGS